MKLTFLGATREVTGSSYLLEVGEKKILVDCGMFQGGKKLERLNRRNFPFNPAAIQAVILTHAHIDHAGLLPRLYKEGFKGKIYATESTRDLCSVMLPDSAHIQVYDSALLNRKGRRSGKPPIEPLYTVEEATDCLKLFFTVEYDKEISPILGVSVRFKDAGHILGSAFVEIIITEPGQESFKIVFSGDLGQSGQPLIKDLAVISNADYLVTEGTYGDQVHSPVDREDALVDIVNKTIEQGGNVIIPSFAVGRAQILLHEFYTLMKKGRIPWVPLYLDSPLAVAATQITIKHMNDLDDEARNSILEADVKLKNFHFTSSVEESKAINDLPGGVIIISASGMADAGRILHHLKYNLWKPECSVVFVGYQAEGTLGRQLISGKKKVRILGEVIAVEAKIYNLEGFSAHADKDEIIDWMSHFLCDLKEIFLIHGEEEVLSKFSKELKEKFNIPISIPYLGDQYEFIGKDLRYLGPTSDVASILEPDVAELFKQFEEEYRNYRSILIDQATKYPEELNSVNQKLSRVRRFLRKSIEDLRK